MEGLDEWLLDSGIKLPPNWTPSTVAINYERPEDIAVALPSGARLVFSHSWNFAPDFNGSRITQKAWIRIAADDSLSFDEAVAVAHRLTNFLCFATDQTVTIDGFLATVMATDGGGGPAKPTEIEILYRSLPFA